MKLHVYTEFYFYCYSRIQCMYIIIAYTGSQNMWS